MGQPGIGSSSTATPREVFLGEIGHYKPGGVIIDASESRDPLNTGDLDTLRAGLLLGKITSGNYAPAILGVTTVAYDVSAAPTSITVSAATAVELVRRKGASGTFELTGPPSAAGTVQTSTVTYSAVDTTTGVITVTSLGAGANEVHTITFDAAMTDGILDVTYWTSTGLPIPVAVAWDTNIATTIAAWNTASTAAATVFAGEASVGAVMTGDATVPVLTFSGVGFAGLAPSEVSLADVGATTGPVDASTVLTTAAVADTANDFIAGSFVQPDDGSEQIMGIQGVSYGVKVTDENDDEDDAECDKFIMGGALNTDVLINYPTDTSLIAWLQSELRDHGLGYTFSGSIQ